MAAKVVDTTFNYHILTISTIQTESADVKVFSFDQDRTNLISYKSGQYLTLIHQGLQGEIRRSYSITSSPELNEPLSIGVKRIENGLYSRWLVDHAKVGDKIVSTGAAGLFTLPSDIANYKQIFFLAAGSGITPIFSLLKSVLNAQPTLSAVLVFSNSSSERAIFLEALKQLAADFPDRLIIRFLFSNSQDLNRARLHKDLLISFLKTLSRGDYRQNLYFICGPANYMRLIFFVLRQQKVPADNIRKEIFNVIETEPPALLPPDTAAYAVTFYIKDEVYQLQSQYPFSILSSAKKKGIPIPYSCETGKCGSCVAKILKGSVWMSNNEVLTDKDVANGLILTCVGYPVDGDVELRIGQV
jgi:ferredoxin-NADP reductase